MFFFTLFMCVSIRTSVRNSIESVDFYVDMLTSISTYRLMAISSQIYLTNILHLRLPARKVANNEIAPRNYVYVSHAFYA